MAQVTKRAQQKRVKGVDTLQAATPPCSVTTGPVKIKSKNSVRGRQISKKKRSRGWQSRRSSIKQRMTMELLVMKLPKA